jgi:hypothetical protein
MNDTKSKHTLFSDFPVGTRVKIVTDVVDFHFWYGDTGIVVENHGRYLGIIVKLDRSRHYEDGRTLETFNFNPDNLVILSKPKESKFNIFKTVRNLFETIG